MAIAPESVKTRRAREKLQKVLESEKEQVTPQALKATVEKIHQWIADHAKERVLIKKGLRLFNQNQDAAQVSKKVGELAQKLKVDMQRPFG